MDSTVLERQVRRIERLKAQGISRSTVLVHDDCRSVLDTLRPHFVNPTKVDALAAIVEQLHISAKPTNVSQVKHLSLFRYPGGKTWLVPTVRQWLLASTKTPSVFVEPFAGGAIVGLTVAAENLANKVSLCELDDDVAAVWETIFKGTKKDVTEFSQRITSFDVTYKNVKEILNSKPRARKDFAFRTIIKNRMQRGGIMAAGAGLVKEGEAGKGLKSRWYPETLVKRIEILRTLKASIDFKKGDAFEVIRQYEKDPNAFFFIDPPYTAGGKKAGSRLYAHNDLDHEGLFKLLAGVKGSVMMTYDDAPEVRELAEAFGFRVESVPMKNTHHAILNELLILKP